MQVLRLLAPRRGASTATTITAATATAVEEEYVDNDDGPFFDLDLSSASVRASSSSSSDDSSSEYDLDLVISLHRSRSGAGLRTLSFARATASSSSSFSRPSSASLRLFMESPASTTEEPRRAPPPSRDVIRRYLTKLSMRLRSVTAVRHRRVSGEGVGFRRLRKSRSASAAVTTDDSVAEKQDGIASAIAHCKESMSLPRSRSDPGNRQAP